MIVQPSFGQRIRRLRRQLGLAQAELAGTEMSASYISLVESGRRTPSDEFAQIIARRLGTGLDELTVHPETDGEPATRPGRRMSLASRLVAAGSARSGGDLESARAMAGSLVADIDSPDDDDLSWEARWLLAEVLGQQGDPAGYESTLEALRTHPFTASSPELRTRVAAALAEHARRRGRLESCVSTAEAALADAGHLSPAAPERLQLETTLLAALAMCEEVRQAQALADRLTGVLPEAGTQLLRSGILWATAAVRFLEGDPGRAADLIDRAGTEVPASAADLNRWAALCRSAAAIRLGADTDPARARAGLHRARQAFELIGQPIDLAELDALEALAHLRAGDPEAALRQARSVPDDLGDVSPARRAGVRVAVARVLAGAGQRDDALPAYRQAAEWYEEAGMYKPAVRVWREQSAGGTPTPIEETAVGWPAVMLPS